jgi:hypothetical protein
LVDVENADAFAVEALGGFLGEFGDLALDITGVEPASPKFRRAKLV